MHIASLTCDTAYIESAKSVIFHTIILLLSDVLSIHIPFRNDLELKVQNKPHCWGLFVLICLAAVRIVVAAAEAGNQENPD